MKELLRHTAELATPACNNALYYKPSPQKLNSVSVAWQYNGYAQRYSQGAAVTAVTCFG